MDKTIELILEASKADDAESKVAILLDHARKAAQDKALGVEDVTKGLKATLSKKDGELASFKALGSVEDIQAVMEKAKLLESEKEATAAGVDNERVEALANERAERKARTAVQEAQAESQRLQVQVEKLSQDREHLVGKLASSYIDQDLYRNGGNEVDPIFWSVLTGKARGYYEIAGNGDQEAGSEWWRSDEPPDFHVVDPKLKTRMTGAEGPMTTKELMESKRRSEWEKLWTNNAQGAGSTSGVPDAGSKRLEWDAPAGDFLDRVIATPTTE